MFSLYSEWKGLIKPMVTGLSILCAFIFIEGPLYTNWKENMEESDIQGWAKVGILVVSTCNRANKAIVITYPACLSIQTSVEQLLPTHLYIYPPISVA